jgi:hypothetical protein
VGGEIQGALGRVESFELGPFVVKHPLTGFIRVGEIADPGKAGNIGGRFLRRFRVIFDYSRQQMILEPNRFYSEPEESDMSGATLNSEPPHYRVIRVG